MTIQSKLAQLDKNWASTKEEFGDDTGGFENPPSGPYVVFKVKAELTQSSNDKLMVKRNCTVKEGDHENERCFDNMVIEQDRGEEFLLKWLNLMGYQVDSLKKDLEDTLAKISENEEASYGVSIKTDKDNGMSNVYYNKVIDEGEAGGAPDAGGSDDTGGEVEEMPDLDEMTMRKLKKLIKDNDFDIDANQDEDDIRDAIEEAWKNKKPVEEKTTGRRAARKKSGGDEKILKGLHDMCDAFGIKCGKNDTLDDFTKTLDGYEFKVSELEEAEATLLKDAGLGKLIK